jgi:hypothetical protein
MKWFRFYSEAVNDPKVQRLPGDLFKLWVNLLCLANENSERGTLPKDVEEIAWRLRMSGDDLRQQLHTLQGQKLLDWSEETGCFTCHNWNERQKPSDDVTSRVNKYRNSSNVTETLHETPEQRFSNALDKIRIDTDKEGEERREEPPSAPAVLVVDNFAPMFEQIWTAYPARKGKKIGKEKLRAKLRALSLTELDSVLVAVKNYAASSTAIRGFARDPVRFMEAEYWKEWLEPEKEERSNGHETTRFGRAVERAGREIAALRMEQVYGTGNAREATDYQGTDILRLPGPSENA